MTATPEARKAAREKFSRWIDRWKETILDKLSSPGYYGKEILSIHANDGVVQHAEETSQKSHR